MVEIIDDKEEEEKEDDQTTKSTKTKSSITKVSTKKLDPAPWLYPKIKIPHRQTAYIERQPWEVCPDILRKGRYISPDFQKKRSYRPDKLNWDNNWLSKINYFATLQQPISRHNYQYPGTRIGHGVMPPVWLVTPSLRHNTIMTSIYDGYPPHGLEFLGQMKKPTLRYSDFVGDETVRDIEMNRGVELCLNGNITPQAFERYWLSPGQNRFENYLGTNREPRTGRDPIRLDQVQYRVNRSKKFDFGIKDSLHNAIDMCKCGAITPEQFEQYWMRPEAYDPKRRYWRRVYN